MRRRHFAAALGALPLAAPSVAPSAWAEGEDWPARSVRIVRPFTPGGSQDNIARRLGAKLGDTLGRSFVIDNRTGAGNSIAADNVVMRQGGFEPGALPLPEVEAFKAEYKR